MPRRAAGGTSVLDQALALLSRSVSYAIAAQTDRWQFAVDYEELREAGLSRVDLRWLVVQGYVRHARETTVPGARERTFTRLLPSALPVESCFVLTEAGCELFCRHDQIVDALPISGGESQGDHSPVVTELSPLAISNSGAGVRHETAVPFWDPHRRELSYGGELVKRFRVPAANQELILKVFQEEGWPESIDDPLPQITGQDPKRRLQATLKSLNRSQSGQTLRFHGNGCGRIVCWERG